VEIAIPLDLESEHPVDLTHIVDLEVPPESILHGLDECQSRSGDGKVVDVSKEDSGEDVLLASEEHRGVVFGSGKTNIGEDLVPVSSTLFKSVEHL